MTENFYRFKGTRVKRLVLYRHSYYHQLFFVYVYVLKHCRHHCPHYRCRLFIVIFLSFHHLFRRLIGVLCIHQAVTSWPSMDFLFQVVYYQDSVCRKESDACHLMLLILVEKLYQSWFLPHKGCTSRVFSSKATVGMMIIIIIRETITIIGYYFYICPLPRCVDKWQFL